MTTSSFGAYLGGIETSARLFYDLDEPPGLEPT